MPTNRRIAYLAHSIRSDWNNGNAHFLRGLLRAMAALGHTVHIFEPAGSWSTQNLQDEEAGARSLAHFSHIYPELAVTEFAADADLDRWRHLLHGFDVVILHEWATPELAQLLLTLRATSGFVLLFHDTHHRASSSPQQIKAFGLERFDGVLAFGNVLRDLYRSNFQINQVWTLHEAADTSVFHPLPDHTIEQDLVWIGNWGDDERSAEIREFLVDPASDLAGLSTTIYGVRYPESGLLALRQAGIRYGGYLPNLDAPAVYAHSRLTVHIPRRQYATTMTGIPTIRVFEALACGIPLLSAPWLDSENLFRPGDIRFVTNGKEMRTELARLLADPALAQAQAQQGLETVLARHTCTHRAAELSEILDEVLQ